MAEAYASARDFVRLRFPEARVAILGGSAATGAATSTSDLDILVIVDDEAGEDGPPDALADICRDVLDAAGGYLQEGFVRGERPSDHRA